MLIPVMIRKSQGSGRDYVCGHVTRKRLTASHHKALKWLVKQDEARNPMEAGLVPFWAFQSLALKGLATVVVHPERGNLYRITDSGRKYWINLHGIGNEHAALS